VTLSPTTARVPLGSPAWAQGPSGAPGRAARAAAGASALACCAIGLAASRRRVHKLKVVAPRGASQAEAPSGVVETFLVKGNADVSKLAASCASLASHMDLACVVCFSLGVPAERIASAAGGSLGLHGMCPVFVADCYGIVGWDSKAGKNVELMEKGRGTEYGGCGGNGGEGVVVVAFRGSGHTPSSVGDESPPASSALHMVVASSGEPAAPSPGVTYGGVAKACYRLDHSGDLVSVPQFVVSSRTGVVSSFTGEAGDAADAALRALPDAGPAAAGYFPCFMRGVNLYEKDGVEPAAFAASGLDMPMFGMFAHGEFGPAKGDPVVCDPEKLSSPALETHSMTSVLALYGK